MPNVPVIRFCLICRLIFWKPETPAQWAANSFTQQGIPIMRKSVNLMSAFAVAAMGAAITPASAASVVLTFDQSNSCVLANNLNAAPGPCTFNAQNISPTYGSTAQLAVTYRNLDGSGNLSDSNLNWTDEGSGQGSAYATGSNGPPEDLEFIFTPAAGFEVALSSIESWVNSGVTPGLGTFTLFNGTQLVSTTAFAASAESLGMPHTVTGFGSGYFSGPLRLHVTPASSRTIQFDNVGLDVRAVGAVGAVPEPTTWAMLILGFGAIGGALRRRNATRVFATA